MGDAANALDGLRNVTRDEGGRFLPGSRARLTHGLRSATLADVPELAAVMRETQDAIEADLGGRSNLSTLEQGAVREVARLDLIVESLGDDIIKNGVQTGKGRKRAIVDVYLSVLAARDRERGRLRMKRAERELPDLAAAFRGEA